MVFQKLLGHERAVFGGVVDADGQNKRSALGHAARAVHGPRPFATEVTFHAALRACGNDRKEKRAAGDVAVDLALEVVAAFEAVHVEPGDDAGGVEGGFQALDGGEIFAGVADEHGAVGHLALGREEAARIGGLRGRGARGSGGGTATALPPAAVQLGDEDVGASGEDLGAAADLLEKVDQVRIIRYAAVGEDFAHFTGIGETAAFREAEEEAHQPVGETAAEDEQVAFLEGGEKFLRAIGVGLERAHELQSILVGEDVGGRRGEPAEEMIDERTREERALRGEIGDFVGGVGDDVGAAQGAEAHGVERVFQETVERGGDVEVEIGDLGELEQRRRRGEGGLAQDGAKAGISILAATAAGEEAHDHIVERRCGREVGGGDAEAGGEARGEPRVEILRTRISGDGEKFRADDGDDALLLDVIEKIVPRIGLKGDGGRCGESGRRVERGRKHRVRKRNAGRGTLNF